MELQRMLRKFESSRPSIELEGPIQIGILGAGPAGLMAALSLEAYFPAGTVEITVIDRNASETDYPGVEYGIQQRACRALERIGQLEAAMVRANPCKEIAFFNARRNKRFRSIFPDAHYTRSVVRQEFLADLAALLRRTVVLRRHIAEQITVLDNGRIEIAGQNADGRYSQVFDLLIACDGVHSIARKQFFAEQATIHDRGFSCIYMLVDGSSGTAPASFLERANSGRSELIMGSIATMTLFPLAKNRLAFGIGFDHGIRDRLWMDHGLPIQTPWKDIPAAMKRSIAEMLTRDAGDPDLVRALDLVDDWDSYKIYLWTMRDSDPLMPPYPAAPANLIVIGDAAHAIMPTIGMGASLAMEDAEALAALLHQSGCTKNRQAFVAGVRGAVLEPFAQQRGPVWHDLIERARLAARGNFLDVGKKKRFAIGPQIPGYIQSKIVSRVEATLEFMGV